MIINDDKKKISKFKIFLEKRKRNLPSQKTNIKGHEQHSEEKINKKENLARNNVNNTNNFR